jgi:hypothetical protein
MHSTSTSGRVALSGRRPLIVIERGAGIPDGLAVDDEGGIWVALWGRAAIRRYDPDGELERVLDVPADNVTACCFGGDDGRSLYVTTASVDLPAERRSAQAARGQRLRHRRPVSRGRLRSRSSPPEPVTSRGGAGRRPRRRSRRELDSARRRRTLRAAPAVCHAASRSAISGVVQLEREALPVSMSIVIESPSRTIASGPPRAAFGCDVADHEPARRAREAAVGDERDRLAQPRLRPPTRSRSTARACPGPAGGPFVADDEHVARLDVAGAHRVGARLLGVEDPRRPGVGTALRAGQLDEASRRARGCRAARGAPRSA